MSAGPASISSAIVRMVGMRHDSLPACASMISSFGPIRLRQNRPAHGRSNYDRPCPFSKRRDPFLTLFQNLPPFRLTAR